MPCMYQTQSRKGDRAFRRPQRLRSLCPRGYLRSASFGRIVAQNILLCGKVHPRQYRVKFRGPSPVMYPIHNRAVPGGRTRLVVCLVRRKGPSFSPGHASRMYTSYLDRETHSRLLAGHSNLAHFFCRVALPRHRNCHRCSSGRPGLERQLESAQRRSRDQSGLQSTSERVASLLHWRRLSRITVPLVALCGKTVSCWGNQALCYFPRHMRSQRLLGQDAGKQRRETFEGWTSPEVINDALSSPYALRFRYGSGPAITAICIPSVLRLTIAVSFGNEQWNHAQPKEPLPMPRQHLQPM